jgi:5-methylcytosine-specific restriction protein A
MPYKPKRPCSHPGCPALTDSQFCPTPAKADARDYAHYRRDPETNKRYGNAWRKIRAAYLAAHPLCEQCQRAGRLTPAKEVHHILPLAQGGTHEAGNLMSLCSSCHSGITLTENNRARS